MLKKLWVVKDLQDFKQTNVLAYTKEQAIILFLMKTDPAKYPDESAARLSKHNCLAIAVLDVCVESK
jgi:hypothetical protein